MSKPAIVFLFVCGEAMSESKAAEKRFAPQRHVLGVSLLQRLAGGFWALAATDVVAF